MKERKEDIEHIAVDGVAIDLITTVFTILFYVRYFVKQ